jgi:hypothetical protein
MVEQIESLKKGRASLLESIKGLTADQLNKIPQGLNNNIIWNLGHMIVVQQGICYKRAGLPTLISPDISERFKPGSQPGEVISDAEIKNIGQLFLTSIDRLAADYRSHAFSNYTAWSTRLGGEVANIDDGIKFLLFHEGLHSGIIMDIKRLVIR